MEAFWKQKHWQNTVCGRQQAANTFQTPFSSCSYWLHFEGEGRASPVCPPNTPSGSPRMPSFSRFSSWCPSTHLESRVIFNYFHFSIQVFCCPLAETPLTDIKALLWNVMTCQEFGCPSPLENTFNKTVFVVQWTEDRRRRNVRGISTAPLLWQLLFFDF